MLKPFSFCFILHKNVLCRLEIDRLSWHDPSDSNTIFLRWMCFPVISRKNLWLQNSIQNKFQKIPKTQENYWFLKAILTLKTFTPIREGLWIIKDEVIFVSDLGGKKYLFIQMIQDHFLCSSIFKIFHTWSSYFDFKINFYNTLCWYSGKDTGLSPERPQFKSLHYQAFLQKAFPWKFFKKWLSPRRIMIWPLKRGEIIRNPSLLRCLSGCGRIQRLDQVKIKTLNLAVMLYISVSSIICNSLLNIDFTNHHQTSS